jgi:hypothetical protein
MQTGAREPARRSFLQQCWKEAISILIHRWRPPQRAEEPR